MSRRPPAYTSGNRRTSPYEETPLPLLMDHIDARAGLADMVGEQQASAMAGVPATQLHKWVTMKRPRVIALQHSTLGWRYPHCQFEPGARRVVEGLATALQGGSLSMLSWMETPLGALGGRAPRAAFEQGESAERVLALAAGAGL
jgi:hypothetical protein